MRLTAFEEHLKALLSIADAEGQPRCTSLADLCRQAKTSRSSMYRRFASAPWERNTRRCSEGRTFTRIATVLQEVKDHLLWLAGYNPFVAQGLSREQLQVLYQIMVQIVYALKQGLFDGKLRKLRGVASALLTIGEKQVVLLPEGWELGRIEIVRGEERLEVTAAELERLAKERNEEAP